MAGFLSYTSVCQLTPSLSHFSTVFPDLFMTRSFSKPCICGQGYPLACVSQSPPDSCQPPAHTMPTRYRSSPSSRVSLWFITFMKPQAHAQNTQAHMHSCAQLLELPEFQGMYS